MRRMLGLGLLLGLFSLPLFAAKNSQVFWMASDVRIGDVQMPGNCEATVTWTEPSASQVQLTIKAKGKTATIPARVIQERGEIRVETTLVNGVRRLKELQTKESRFIIQNAQTQDAPSALK